VCAAKFAKKNRAVFSNGAISIKKLSAENQASVFFTFVVFLHCAFN